MTMERKEALRENTPDLYSKLQLARKGMGTTVKVCRKSKEEFNSSIRIRTTPKPQEATEDLGYPGGEGFVTTPSSAVSLRQINQSQSLFILTTEVKQIP